MHVSFVKMAVVCLVLTGLYYLAARLGLSLAFEQANTSPVWPPTGIAIAAVLYFGYRVWPGIFLGALLVNLSSGAPTSAAVLVAIGNTLEALVALWLLKRYADVYPFSRIFHTALFLVFTLLAAAISATIGVSSLFIHDLINASQYPMLWQTWWLGDAVGGIVLTPILLMWFRTPLHRVTEDRYTKVRLMELTALIVITLVMSGSIFWDWSVLSHNANLANLLIFLMPPLLMWSALRFHHHGTTLMLLIISTASVIGTLRGYGPFVLASENESLLLLQACLGATMTTVLFLIASQEERLLAKHTLVLAQQDLELKVEQRTEELHSTNNQLATEIAQQHQLSNILQSLVDSSDATSSHEIIRGYVRALAAAYGTRYAMVAVYAEDHPEQLTTLAVWNGDHFAQNFSYALKGTPCQDVLDRSIELIPDNAAERYPEDRMLDQMAIESYFGAPLLLPEGKLMGVISVMDTQPLAIKSWAKPMFGLFASRVALEIQRQSIQEELELAAKVFKESIEAIVICTADLRVVKVNPSFTRITGYSADEIVGQSPSVLQSGAHSKVFYQDFWESLNKTGVWQGEIIDRRKNGEAFPAWQTITRVCDSAGEIQHFISIFSDVTEKKLSEERIYNLAHNDLVTKLPNRATFCDRMKSELDHAQRMKAQMAVMFIDLDHFKLVNDSAGHQVGDLLLQQVAERLKSQLRQDDTVARFGGDEFAVLLPSIQSSDEAGIVAGKIVAGLVKPFRLEGHEVTVSASVGISIYPNNGEDVTTLVRNADSAMYQAKERGRNNFQFYTEDMNRYAQERLALEYDLRRALERNEFVLHYQPQVDLRTGKITGSEALIRWQHPEKGLIFPDEFIPAAEISGLIVEIGKWVLNTALKQHRQWRDQVIEPLVIAVNLSSRQFKQSDLLKTIQVALDDSGVSASELELELTESMMIDQVDEAVIMLQTIQALGIRLSIDDFGTGFSSMTYLKRFPIHKIKIDKSFIAGLPGEQSDLAIVQAIIAIAHGLKLTVVAEGVETFEQLECLKTLNCTEVQGYYFSRPIPANELTELLIRNDRNYLPVHDSSLLISAY